MSATNPNSRLEAFCDGVFAIALTLLIIDIKLPGSVKPATTAGFLTELNHLLPSILTFIMSFIVIFITWVNHHNSSKLLNKSSTPFIYANGLLLLTVVFVPFPTSLVGEYITTDHAAPAVILYNAVLALQAASWVLMSGAASRGRLCKDEKATKTIERSGRFAYFGLLLYSLCAVLAYWMPVLITFITAGSWLFWLAYGLSIKQSRLD